MSHGYSGKLIASNEYRELQRLEDFEGKTIGVQASTGVHTVFQMAIDRIGLTDSDFDIRNVRVQDMPAAMQGGEFDAVLGWEPGMSRIVEVGTAQKLSASKILRSWLTLTCPQNWSSLKVSLRGFLDIGKFLRVVGFRSRWAIAQRAVGPDRVVLTTPLLDEYLSFP